MPTGVYKRTKEHREKLSKIFSGKGNPFYGRKHTEEAKKKMSEVHKGKIPWNKGLKGIHFSPRTEIKKGQHLSLKTEIKKRQHLSPETEFKKGHTPWIKGKKMSLEFRRYLSKVHKGIQAKEKHPNWKGGLDKYNKDRLKGLEWRIVREKVLIRDKYSCQKCGRRDNLVVHHKKDPEDNSLNNLITLCVSCHTKLHWELFKKYKKQYKNVK